MYAIELFVDSKLDQYVRHIWKELKEAHITAYVQDIKAIRPHLTLAYYDHIDDIDLFVRKFDEYVEDQKKQGKLRRLAIRSEFIGVFPQLGNLHLGITLTEPLMELHRHFYQTFGEYEGTARSFYLPDNWKPHLTLASKLSVSDLLRTMEFVTHRFGPITGETVEIGIVGKIMKEDRFDANYPVYSRMLLP